MEFNSFVDRRSRACYLPFEMNIFILRTFFYLSWLTLYDYDKIGRSSVFENSLSDCSIRVFECTKAIPSASTPLARIFQPSFVAKNSVAMCSAFLFHSNVCAEQLRSMYRQAFRLAVAPGGLLER